MTQHDQNPHAKLNNANAGQQTGTRTITAFQGPLFLSLEDFARTIRSYCSRVTSPPIEPSDQARRRRFGNETGYADANKNQVQFGKEIMTRTTNQNQQETGKTNIFHGGKNMSEATIFKSLVSNRMAVSIIALGTALGSVTPAFADISNTVTVTGSSPGNTGDIVETATETVDPVDAAPSSTLSKVATFDLGAGTVTADGTTDNVPSGTVVTYTYTLVNTGNVGLTNVSLSDDHATDADGTLGTITLGSLTPDGVGLASSDDGADNDYDYLAPGDTITWTASYTVTTGDISGSGGGDGVLTNTVTASGGYQDSTGAAATHTDTATEILDLEDANPSLLVAKSASPDTDVALGATVTYTYTITNNGNVPIADISLSDSFNGLGSFTAPNPDSGSATITNTSGLSNDVSGDTSYDELHPGDVITMTVSYVVTQEDIDQRQ